MAKKQELVSSALTGIINKSSPDRTLKEKKPNPLGVLLEKNEIAELSSIADQLGVKRHHVLQYAVRQFIADWANGKRPKVVEEKTTTIKIKLSS